jgi:hypothetical protein
MTRLDAFMTGMGFAKQAEGAVVEPLTGEAAVSGADSRLPDLSRLDRGQLAAYDQEALEQFRQIGGGRFTETSIPRPSASKDPRHQVKTDSLNISRWTPATKLPPKGVNQAKLADEQQQARNALLEAKARQHHFLRRTQPGYRSLP